ncbi:Ppx/GppA phosphatase family protein [Rhizorhapis suberifaciens]|uniref:Ppx/GppA phosphatase family protein n=1 Tax=Rhizorhapis suberifaciens TaxID=13656 RepID=UPI001607E181
MLEEAVLARPRPLERPKREAFALVTARIAIIDIGSNSVRLVVYDGPRRIPFILFNEKVMAGLGASLAKTGAIEEAAMRRGLTALGRFHQLCREMEVDEVRCVATAAVREASNGSEFIRRAEALGLKVRLLSGEEEARGAAYGVLSAIPDADGIVGDLGGGSLELVRVSGGEVRESVSLPLGVLRLPDIRVKGQHVLDRHVAKLLEKAGWDKVTPDLPFYLVGGSWRALARLDMHQTGFPLPVIHHYDMEKQMPAHLVRVLASTDKNKLRAISSLSSSRIPTLSDAALLLSAMVRHLDSAKLIVSAFGLREGLLFQDLPSSIKALDPLLTAAAAEGETQGRFRGHGDLIDRWIAPIFRRDHAEWSRIRRAACLLADVGWRANPEFRAERGLEIALHGNWVGIDVAGRAMLAQALYSHLGGGTSIAPEVEGLAPADALQQAIRWGLAIRLAQRLSGGVAGPLELGALEGDGDALRLVLANAHAALFGEAVERRLRHLATAMGLRSEFVLK